MPRKPSKKKTSKKKTKTVPKAERLRRYGEILISNPKASYNDIKDETGIPIGTIKSDFYRMRSKGSPETKGASVDKPRDNATTLQPVKTETPGSFDWNGTMDKVGKVASSLFGQSISGSIPCGNCGAPVSVPKDSQEARKWATTFSRLFMSRMRADQIMLVLNTAPVPVEKVQETTGLSQHDLVRAALLLNEGRSDCIVCGGPLHEPIDAEYKVQEGGEGESKRKARRKGRRWDDHPSH